MNQKIKLIYLILTATITISFAQTTPISNQVYFDKLIKAEKTTFLGYRYYTQKNNTRLNSFALNSLFKEEKAANSINLLRKSKLIKISAILLIASTWLIPDTKIQTTTFGGFPATVRSPNYGNQILSIGIVGLGGLAFNFGQRTKSEAVMEYNSKVKRKYFK